MSERKVSPLKIRPDSHFPDLHDLHPRHRGMYTQGRRDLIWALSYSAGDPSGTDCLAGRVGGLLTVHAAALGSLLMRKVSKRTVEEVYTVIAHLISAAAFLGALYPWPPPQASNPIYSSLSHLYWLGGHPSCESVYQTFRPSIKLRAYRQLSIVVEGQPGCGKVPGPAVGKECWRNVELLVFKTGFRRPVQLRGAVNLGRSPGRKATDEALVWCTIVCCVVHR